MRTLGKTNFLFQTRLVGVLFAAAVENVCGFILINILVFHVKYSRL